MVVVICRSLFPQIRCIHSFLSFSWILPIRHCSDKKVPLLHKSITPIIYETSLKNLPKGNAIHTRLTNKALSHVHECEYCDRAFSSELYLNEHMERFHLNHPYQCPHCESTFSYKSNLNSHIVSLHGYGLVKKQYVCHFCQKVFPTPSKLAEHVIIHTGEKPFKCNTCGKGFNTKGYLTVHQRIHSGEKPFACKVCGEIFSDLSYLYKHQLIHTGQKPFKCRFCDYRSTTRIKRDSHERRIHLGKI